MCLLGSEILSQTPTTICHRRTLKSASVQFSSCVAILSEKKFLQTSIWRQQLSSPSEGSPGVGTVNVVAVIDSGNVETCSIVIVVVNKVNVDIDKWIQI